MLSPCSSMCPSEMIDEAVQTTDSTVVPIAEEAVDSTVTSQSAATAAVSAECGDGIDVFAAAPTADTSVPVAAVAASPLAVMLTPVDIIRVLAHHRYDMRHSACKIASVLRF